MPSWEEHIRSALVQLGADKVLTRGAKLRATVETIALQSGQDLSEYLRDSGTKFGQLLDGISDVIVHRVPGTDMYVGLEGATVPEPVAARRSLAPIRERTMLRQDVYGAFTRVSERPYYYLPGQDLFTRDTSASEPKIEVPRVSLENLIEERRMFANQMDDEGHRTDVLSALDHSANPLGSFKYALVTLRLSVDWHQFKLEKLTSEIQTWATENSLSMSPAWTLDAVSSSAGEAPQELLALFSQFMTNDEVRTLNVPFRAVESMYVAMSRRHRNQP